MKKQKATFTLFAFHCVLNDPTRPAELSALIARLNSESVCVDQGVYILRSQEDAALLDECADYLLSSRRPFVSVKFDPRDELVLQYGYIDSLSVARLEQWLDHLKMEET